MISGFKPFFIRASMLLLVVIGSAMGWGQVSHSARLTYAIDATSQAIHPNAEGDIVKQPESIISLNDIGRLPKNYYSFVETAEQSVEKDAGRKTQTLGLLTNSSDYFRSRYPAGSWNVAADWESSVDNMTWQVADAVPDYLSGGILIQAGHIMSINTPPLVVADQLVVAAGGTLILNVGSLTLNDGNGTDLQVYGTFTQDSTGIFVANSGSTVDFASGATYNHTRPQGTIPSATWNAASNCNVTGFTNGSIGGMGQNFGNFTWNCSAQTINYTINEANFGTKGTFTVSKTGDPKASIDGFSIYLSLWNGGPTGSTGSFAFGSIVTKGTGILIFNDQTNNDSGTVASYTSYVHILGDFSITETSAVVPSSGNASTVTGSIYKSVAFLGGDLLLTPDATLFVYSYRYSIFLFNKAGTQKINFNPSNLTYPIHQRLSYAITPKSTVEMGSSLNLFSYKPTGDYADFSVSGMLDCKGYVLGDESTKRPCTAAPCTDAGQMSNFYLAGITELMPEIQKTLTVSTQAGSDMLTSTGNDPTTFLVAGMLVTGAGIPTGTYILGMSSSAKTITLSSYATATTSNTVVTFASNGKIITSHAGGLNSTGLAGSIQTIGQRRFASTADYTFNGATQNTGSFTTSPDNTLVNSLEIDASTAVTNNYGASLTVTGTLKLTSGNFNVGSNTLGVNGPAIAGNPANLNTTSSSSLSFGGSSTGIAIPASVVALNNLTINNANGVALNSSPVVSGVLNLTTGALAIGSNTLTLNGTTAGAGFLKGSNTSNLIVGGTGILGTLNFDQTLASSRSLNNLTVGESSSATLGTALDVYGNINTNSTASTGGSLDLNGKNLTLKSNSTNTAGIFRLMVAGTNLTGATNVTIERYISALNNRAYRQLGSTVNTATGSFGGLSTGSKPYIRENWQEGQNNTLTGYVDNNNLVPGYGTHITGNATGLNGFDATATGNASLYVLGMGTGTINNSFVGIGNTDVTTLEAKKGYLLFVRGSRSVNLNSNSSVSNSDNTILRTTGSLLTGDQNFTSLVPNEYNFITNPFASAIDWNSIYSNGNLARYSSKFYVYCDPNIGTRGGYVSVDNDGGNNIARTPDSAKIIQSGQAFWVSTGAGINTITIREQDKSGTNNLDIFRTNDGTIERLQMSLYYYPTPTGRRIADGIAFKFGNNYSAGIGGEDATKFTNFDEEVAVLRDGVRLSIEGRPLVDQADTLPISMAKMKVQPYEWQFNPGNFNAPGLLAYLQDKFLDSEIPISLTEQTQVPFAITSDAASSAADRFKVVFRSIVVLPINFTQVKAFEKGSAVQVEWNLANETAVKAYEIEKSTDGRSFTKGGTQAVRTISSGDNYAWLDVTPNNGNNFYRIKVLEQNGPGRYSQVVNVKVGKGNAGISVFPNPVKGSSIGLQFTNQPKGKYAISLYDNLGRQVYRSEFNHIGGSASQTLQLNNKLATGIYNLSVTNGETTNTQNVVVE